ncbi:type II 3-dehydroquinate dehydratase [Corynebacterium sp. H128]|uniref:type II 3-dehydroquinate dehydratase n=1 Tax=unclassified Corynebacterium TaxID=2624378 RepID=UPI0030B76532
MILVLNGPNLDRLGKRQPEIYGATTLIDVEKRISAVAAELALEVECRQSNHEGVLIDWVHEAAEKGWQVIINPGGYTHTSVALRDALVEVEFIEVHISNVHAREPFRQHSFLSPIAKGVIAGLGTKGYELALRGMAEEVR